MSMPRAPSFCNLPVFVRCCELLESGLGREAASSLDFLKLISQLEFYRYKSASKWGLLFAEVTDKVDKFNIRNQNAISFG